MVGSDGECLLERESALAAIAERLDMVGIADGSLIGVCGTAGVGKTALVRAASQMARRSGLMVLSATGGELEIDFPFGVVRQLFEPVMAQADAALRERLLSGAASLAAPLVTGACAPPADSSFPLLHGLYWLTANLAAETALAIVVDDAHWCDRQTLAWLSYQARRLRGLRVLVVVAARSAEPGSNMAIVDQITEYADAALCANPLSENATGRLVATVLPDSAADLAPACWRVTGGNPFLLKELLRELSTGECAAVDGLMSRPQTWNGSSVSRSVRTRLARISPDAVTLAQAAVVLGTRPTLANAARLAGCTPDVAAGLADSMVSIGVLSSADPVTFLHPLIQAAVYHDMPAAQRDRTHLCATRLLARTGAPPEEIATHLARTQPGGRPETVDVLLQAAEKMLAQADPQDAIIRLQRALAEPPTAQQLPHVLHLLGKAQALSGDAAGIAQLERAMSASVSATQRAEVSRDLAEACLHEQRLAEAKQALAAGMDGLLTDPDAAVALRAQLVGLGRLDPGGDPELVNRHLAKLRDDAASAGPYPSAEQRVALTTVAAVDGQTGRLPAQAVAAAVKRALGDGELLAAEGGDSGLPIVAGLTLLCADHVDAARAVFDAIIAYGQRRASRRAYMQGLCLRALLHQRTGALLDAAADVQASLELVDSPDPFLMPMKLSILVDILVERGMLDQAQQVLAQAGATGRLPGGFHDSYLYCARGKLQLAQHRHTEALDDLQEAGRIKLACDMANPALLPWRAPLAAALVLCGRKSDAVRLADEDVSLAQAYGAPRAIGVALRGRGRVEPDPQHRIRLLRQAVDTLRPSRAPLEYAHALADLGAAIRRANQRTAAREPLRAALDLAHRCHATALATWTMNELRATGARPRRRAATGIEALTHSEYRVAQLASKGHSNRDIAQALFITAKTVEDHLSSTYAKLGIVGRRHLPHL